MKRLTCFGFVVLSACASVPQVADLALADRIAAEISRETGETCDLVRYQDDGRVSGNIFLAYKNQLAQDQAKGAKYTVQCRSHMTYGVLLPDDPQQRSWVYQCFDGDQAFEVGCDMWGPFSGTRHRNRSD